MFICHQYNVCEKYIGRVYVGGFCGLSESGLCVFGELCPVGFLAVCKSLSVLLQSVERKKNIIETHDSYKKL